MTQARRVGVIGVGNMGGAIALNLLDQGWHVQVRDVDPAKMPPLVRAGALLSESPAAAASGCGLLVVCVVDADQAREVLFGAEGAAQALPPGAGVVVCPTISPADAEGVAADLRRAGLLPVDAPMSGGPARARDGSMSLMVACDDVAYQRCAPLLEAMSRKIFRVGVRCGDGARTKLVNNLLAGINLAGAAEVMAAAQRMGLDLGRTLDVIEQSSGQSWIASDRMRRAIAEDYEPRAHMTLLQKDTRLAVEAASAAGFESSVGALARDVFERAVQSGLGTHDDAALFLLFSQRLANDTR